MDEVAKYVYNEKYTPKKYRLTLGLDLVHKADEIYDNATFANEIYLKKENYAARRRLWTKAMANCKQLDRKLQRMRAVIPSSTLENMKEILKLLNLEKGAIAERLDRER